MRATRVFASPSTHEGFGITLAEAMATDGIVIPARHPESAASEVLGKAGLLVKLKQATVSETLERALAGKQPQAVPQECAAVYNWKSVASLAESVYAKTVRLS